MITHNGTRPAIDLQVHRPLEHRWPIGASPSAIAQSCSEWSQSPPCCSWIEIFGQIASGYFTTD